MAAGKYEGRYRMSATPAVLMAQICAAAAITLMLIWILHFRGGFSLKADDLDRLLNDKISKEYSYTTAPEITIHHSSNGELLCRSLLINFYTLAIMTFKMVPGRRKVRKIVHMLLNLAGLALGGLGLYAIFKVYTKYDGVPNVRSLHSWTGLGVIGLYIIQFFVGFTCFLFPGSTLNVRANVRPWHALFGAAIFTLSVLTSNTGLIQRFRFLGLLSGREALIVNFTGISIILFGMFVILSVILP